MNLHAKQFAKLTLIFFGLLFLVCVWTGRRMQKEEETVPEGEKITVEDVEILLDALGGSFSMSETDKEEIAQSGLEADGEEGVYFTYGQYEKLCRQIETKDWGLPDYSDRYKPEYALLKEDWYKAFRILFGLSGSGIFYLGNHSLSTEN